MGASLSLVAIVPTITITGSVPAGPPHGLFSDDIDGYHAKLKIWRCAMRRSIIGPAVRVLAGIVLGAEAPPSPAQAPGQLARQQYTAPNRKIDYDGFLKNAMAVSKLREERRVSEQDFVEM